MTREESRPAKPGATPRKRPARKTAAAKTAAAKTSAPRSAARKATTSETIAPETTASKTAALKTAASKTGAPKTAAPKTTAPTTAAPMTVGPMTVGPMTAAPMSLAAPLEKTHTGITDLDLHLFNEGTHYRLWEKLGAQIEERAGVRGVRFAVWAPGAREVSVVGDFNRWDPGAHPMQSLAKSGIWETFVPELKPGALYKFHIRSRLPGRTLTKADPYGFFMERRPDTASVVWDLAGYGWSDGAWMAARRTRQAQDAPISIYEVHPGSWRRQGDRWLGWRELAATLIPYAKDMGFTHLELMPVTEHPFDGSWGYQTVGYYAPTSRFGNPDDFRAFVDAAHQADLGVLLDWVPAHFPKDAHGLGEFDGTHLYEHADPRKGQHHDWGTYIFNFGRPEVCAFLISNALFWLEQYHVDGLRVDAVASMIYLDYSRKEGEWVPNRYGGRENLEAIEFLKRTNQVVHERFPDVLTFAEESTAWPMVSRPVHLGGLGFDLKWNMGWMHDTLEYMRLDPIYRRNHQHKLTFSIWYAFTENFLLALSHDEVVHLKRSLLSKMPGDRWRKLANLRALFGLMWAHPGKKLLFMGGEIGSWREWNHDAELEWGLLDDPMHLGLQRWVRSLNRLLAAEPALHQVDFAPAGFEWIDFRDVDQSVIAFCRKAQDPEEAVVVVANLTPVPRHGYQIGVPRPGPYRVLLSSDATEYGGSGVGNPDVLPTVDQSRHGFAHTLTLTLPPLAVVYLKPAAVAEEERREERLVSEPLPAGEISRAARGTDGVEKEIMRSGPRAQPTPGKRAGPVDGAAAGPTDRESGAPASTADGAARPPTDL